MKNGSVLHGNVDIGLCIFRIGKTEGTGLFLIGNHRISGAIQGFHISLPEEDTGISKLDVKTVVLYIIIQKDSLGLLCGMIEQVCNRYNH